MSAPVDPASSPWRLGGVYDVPVPTVPRRSTLPGLLAAAVLAAGCALPESRRYERLANAQPEQDPASRGTVQGQNLPLSEAEQMVLPLGNDAFGNVVVRQEVSPTFTPEQEQEVRRAFTRDDWKRQFLPLPDTGLEPK
jgi:hypothetical protein